MSESEHGMPWDWDPVISERERKARDCPDLDNCDCLDGEPCWLKLRIAKEIERELKDLEAPPPIPRRLLCPNGHDRPDQWCSGCHAMTTAAREQGKQEYAASKASDRMPEMINLVDLLAEPDEPTAYLIDRVWPKEGRVILSAPAKAGKTTLRNNAIRSLVDGAPFLGIFEMPKVVERVVVLDLELTRSMQKRWLRRQRIDNIAAVDLVPMRGQAHALDPRAPGRWVEYLRGADVVILDCLEPVLHALDLNPNVEARKFLEDWAELLTEAGVGANKVIHHHGHGAERAKGDSGILAWPDALWDIVYETQGEVFTPRYFGAQVRSDSGEDVPLMELELDPETGRLRAKAGTNRDIGQAQRKSAEAVTILLRALLADHERRVGLGEQPQAGMSVHWDSQSAVIQIGRAAGLTRDPAKAALSDALTACWVMRSRPPKGAGSSGAMLHALTTKGMEKAWRAG
jgi:hypothetical protein